MGLRHYDSGRVGRGGAACGTQHARLGVQVVHVDGHLVIRVHLPVSTARASLAAPTHAAHANYVAPVVR